MIKKIYIIFIFLILTTNSYAAKKSGATGSEGGEYIPKGPPPAKKYTLGFKEMKRGIKLENKGKLSKARTRYEKAIEYLLESNSENPMNPITLNYLGFLYEKTENLDYAEIYYRLGLEIEPKNYLINMNLGKFYLTTNKKNKAIKRLKVLESCNCKEYLELKKFIQNK